MVSLLSLQLLASATNQAHCIITTDSVPPYRLCIFVLCRFAALDFRPVGTAVAVRSAGRNILLTAGHCVKFTQASYFCVPHILHPFNFVDVPSGAFAVDVIACSSDSPDIAILRRSDGGVFDINCPALMPVGDLPWNKNPHGWGGQAYVYHVPLDIIDHATNDEAGTPDVVGDVDHVVIHMPSRHHFRLKSFERGSSGGAVISSDGRLMGVLAKTQLYGTLTMDGVRMHTSGGLERPAPKSSLKPGGGERFAAIERCGETDEKEGDRHEDGWSISATSTAIPEKGSTAVIPSSVNLHFRGPSLVVPLPNFLQEEPPDANGREVQLALAAKEGGKK